MVQLIKKYVHVPGIYFLILKVGIHFNLCLKYVCVYTFLILKIGIHFKTFNNLFWGIMENCN